MSDLALARSFLEHALRHLKHADEAIDHAYDELEPLTRERAGIFGLRGDVRRLVAAIESVDRFVALLASKEHPPPAA